MKLKALFITLFSLMIVSLVALAILSFSSLKHQTHLIKSQDIRFRSYLLANEIKESSNALTRYCRTYAMTGDSVWEKKYWEVLDIRNGNKPRPDGKLISLQDSIKRLGLTTAELIKLQEAEYNSNQLVYTEERAFNALKGLYPDANGNYLVNRKPDTAYSRSILFGNYYHQENARINKPIDDFFAMLNNRTQVTVQESSKTSQQLLSESMSLILVIVLISVISFIILSQKITIKLKELEVAKKKIEKNERLLIEQNDILDKKVTERTAELKNKNEIYAALNEQYKELNNDLEEASLRAQESDLLKTKFLNSISHEVRTPMNGILGFTSLIQDPELDKTTRNYYINIIQENGEQLVKIIDSILELSQLSAKQETVQEKATNLNETIKGIYSKYKDDAIEQSTPILLFLPDEEDGNIYTDPKLLRRILSNLVNNAIKFTPKGSIEVGYEIKNNTELEIYVSDTGVGIGEDHIKNIFNSFSQEDGDFSIEKGGLGIGLAIAKKNTKLLGGSISLESKKNIGSKFVISLPYKPVNAKIESANNDNIETQIKHIDKTILIVEEEEVNYNYLNFLLKKGLSVDYNIIHLKHSDKIIEACHRFKNVSLVLIDLNLSNKVNTEIVNEIKHIYPQLPIIVQSAYHTLDEKNNAIKKGFDDLITKPISKDSLINLLSVYLGYDYSISKKKPDTDLINADTPNKLILDSSSLN